MHDHRVARAGALVRRARLLVPLLYMRTVPSHAIEMTAARLHEHLLQALGPERGRPDRAPDAGARGGGDPPLWAVPGRGLRPARLPRSARRSSVAPTIWPPISPASIAPR